VCSSHLQSALCVDAAHAWNRHTRTHRRTADSLSATPASIWWRSINIDATTAEKLEEFSRGVDADPVPCPPPINHTFHTRLVFRVSLHPARRSREAPQSHCWVLTQLRRSTHGWHMHVGLCVGSITEDQRPPVSVEPSRK